MIIHAIWSRYIIDQKMDSDESEEPMDSDESEEPPGADLSPAE
jgi:hypothetical protein